MSHAKTVFGVQPDKKHVVCTTSEKPGEKPECAVISEKEFMKQHSFYSAASSWLFAIAGATNIGVLGVVASRMLTAAEQNRPLFKSKDPNIEPVMGNKKYNRMALMMVGFGGVCMAVSNWLESKKVVTEWQLGAGKLQRKVTIAENEGAKAAIAASPPSDSSTDNTSPASAAAAKPKNWTASTAKIPEVVGRSA